VALERGIEPHLVERINSKIKGIEWIAHGPCDDACLLLKIRAAFPRLG
jgi:hypothetical protein